MKAFFLAVALFGLLVLGAELAHFPKEEGHV